MAPPERPPVTQVAAVQRMEIVPAQGWDDNSMLALTARQPGASGVTANLVVTREPLPPAPGGPADRIEAHVDRQLDNWRGLPGYDERMRRRATPAATVAEVRIAHAAEGVALVQWVTYVPVGDTVLVAAATAAECDFAQMEPQFRDMLQSLRLD